MDSDTNDAERPLPPSASASSSLTFWNKSIVQITFVGCLAFAGPGMFNALNGLGKAGGKAEDVGNSANATLNAFFAVFGYFGGAFFNLFGNKLLMLVGGFTYAVYAGGIYWASNVENGKWIAAVAGAILGFGAGWFWTAQGAMMMSYATPERKGLYIGIFWIIFNLGGSFGGLLSMGLNWNRDSGDASPVSYFVFVGIMLAGAIGSLALAKPNNVIREDGLPVVFQPAQSAKEEILGALKVCTNKHMLLLTVLFISSNWFYPYQFNAVNGSLFNIRTRGFNSALYWGSQMLGAYSIGKLLDRRGQSVKSRAFWGLTVVGVVRNVAFAMGAGLQYGWDDNGLWDKQWGVKEDGTSGWIPPFAKDDLVDLTHSSRAAYPIIVYLFYALGDAMLQTYAYWVMGALAGDDTRLAARYAGYYKGVQSAGAAVAWGLDLGIRYEPQFWICWVLVIVSLPLIYIAIRDLDSTTDNQLALKESLEVSMMKGRSSIKEEDGFDTATKDKLVQRDSKSSSGMKTIELTK